LSSTRRFNCRQAGDLIVADQSALERKKNALFADNRVFQIEMEELVNPFERIPTPGSFLTDLIGFDPKPGIALLRSAMDFLEFPQGFPQASSASPM
jgi:hypothetical protein